MNSTIFRDRNRDLVARKCLVAVAITTLFVTSATCTQSLLGQDERAEEQSVQDGHAPRKQKTEDQVLPTNQDPNLNPPTNRRNNRKRAAAKPTVFWPGDIEFDKSIPAPKEFFGFDIGERHLRHDQIVSYVYALAEVSDRISVEQYGETHGKRPLLLLTITSPNNHSKIDSIKASHRQLAKPAESSDIDIESLPMVMNMGYSVHGDEPSAGNCAALVAYYLAAAQGDAIERTLESVVVLLDPTLNPDGFDRFARWANMYRGRNLNANPSHAEHNQGWPAGRVNYYWFDLNRDWLPLVHPESQARMKWYHSWKPNVVLDFHEMGTNSTFFFQPGVPQRTNPLTPKRNIELTGQIGSYHSRAFDDRKAMYFTQELFDDFYMGKGSTYPDLHGSIGILFEQASSRGHLQESDNGLLSFPMTIENQFSASRSSLDAATEMRTTLLEYTRSFYQSAQEEAGSDDTKVHVFASTGNPSRLQAFADLLIQHDIQCYRLKHNMRFGDDRFDKRFTLVVPTDQPEYRFFQSLIERRTEFEENIFYDVSAWSIPLAYNLEHFQIQRSIDVAELQEIKLGESISSKVEFSDADVAYLIDWRDDTAPKWLYRFLEQGLVVKVATRPVTIEENNQKFDFGYGSLMIPLGISANKQQLVRRLLTNAAKQGLRIQPVTSGLTVAEGVDIGSSAFRKIEQPEVGMFIENSVRFYEAGEIWHALDTKVEIPVTLLKNNSTHDLSRYNTLIMVSGSSDSSGSVKSWVRNGGTLIAAGSAINFANSMLSADEPQQQQSETAKATEPDAEGHSSEIDTIQKPFADAQDEQALKLISGAIFNAKIDPTHPLFFGFENDSLAVFRNHNRVLEKSVSPYGNPLVYATPQPLLAGYASIENQEKLAGTPGIVIHSLGRGRIIMMTDDMNFRGFWLGTQRVFFNAIFFGEFTDPPRQRIE